MCYIWFDLLKFVYKKICFCFYFVGDSDEIFMIK